jgi:hypothetical protein
LAMADGKNAQSPKSSCKLKNRRLHHFLRFLFLKNERL